MTLENIFMVSKIVAILIASVCLLCLAIRCIRLDIDDDRVTKELKRLREEQTRLNDKCLEFEEQIEGIFDACEEFYDEEYLPFVESCGNTSAE